MTILKGVIELLTTFIEFLTISIASFESLVTLLAIVNDVVLDVVIGWRRRCEGLLID